MPGAASNGFCPDRFAALMARFETPNEAEAMNAARALRRMAAMNNLRFCDALGRADVMAALDVQLKPVREENPQLKAALEQAAALREELTERTRNVRELAELLRRQEETSEGLRQQVKALSCKPAAPPRASSCPRCKVRRVGEPFFDGLFALVVVWSGVALLFTFAVWAVRAVFG